MTRRRTDLLTLGMTAWQASFEAQQVIALRMAKLALGGEAARKEANAMVSEKAAAAVQVNGDAVAAMLTGAAAAVPLRTVSTYRRKVLANRRRLLKEIGG